jgi:DNA-binding SARP family transcriptional activator/DNA-binding XRE family transcriptional regulator
MMRGQDERARRMGALIRQYRHAAGLTQQELADRAGMSIGAVRDLEQGRTSRPRDGALRRLAASLGLDEGQRRELESAVSGKTWATAALGAGAGAGAGQRAAGAGARLNILGPLAAWRDGEPVKLGPSRQRAVLGLVAVHHGVALHRDVIIDALWGEHPPVSAVSMIQSYVSRLRRALQAGPAGAACGSCCLEPAGTGYRLRPGPGFDLLAFDAAAERARAALGDGDAAAACEGYDQALALWRGEPLADVEILRSHPAVVSLGRRRGTLILEYAGAACALGEPERVLPLLRSLAAADPFDERVHARLMIVLACGGQQAAALGVYDGLRGRLDAELGVRPGAELADAHTRVLRQEIPAGVADRPHPADRRPVQPVAVPAVVPVVPRQLPAAARHFTGRVAELRTLTRLRQELRQPGGGPVAAVIGGPAGAGKSALALRWAHAVSEEFPDGQLYVDLRGSSPLVPGPVSAAKAIRGFLGALGGPAELPPGGAQAHAGLYRSLLAGKRMLIMLDDARDSAQVRPLLPGTPGCLVLVTSRWQLADLAVSDCAHLLTVAALSSSEARQMLARRLGQERVAAEPEAVTELIELCARLPMALAIAATRATALPGLSMAALAAEMRGAARRPEEPDSRDRCAEAGPRPGWSPGADGAGGQLLRLPA